MTPILASDTKAAKLLDLPKGEFLRLVQAGALPRPVKVGTHERWRVSDLAAIGSGAAMSEEFET